jgi:5'-nucleotidase
MHKCRILLALLLAVCLFTPAAAQFRQPEPYRILVTNDDGVRTPGIAALAQILQAIGTPIIVAPSATQSGKGHSIVTSEAVVREDLTLPNGLRAIGLTATPASTVNIALRNIVTPRPDLVVAGINRSYNLGLSAYVSGTVGGAREAAFHGVSAIAASMSASATAADLAFAAEEVFGVARRVKQYGLPPNTFLNVNVPAAAPPGGYKGYMITTQAMVRGGEEYFAEMQHPAGRTIYWSVYAEGKHAPQPQGTDIWAIENGYTSVTPMGIGETDQRQMETLRAIFK